MKFKRIMCFILCIFMLFTFSNCTSTAVGDNDIQSSADVSLSSEKSVSDNKKDKSETIFDSNNDVTTADTSTKEKNSSTEKGSTVENKTKNTTGCNQKTEKTQQKNTTANNTKKHKNNAGKTEKQSDSTKKTYTCTISIDCSTILDNIKKLDPDKAGFVPSNGVILSARTVKFTDGDSVYDVLERACKANKIQLEASWTGGYNSAYVEGINNIYEFDCGSASGWKYRVNGKYPNYGCSSYKLKQGDSIEFCYTCNYGKDIA